MYLTKQHRPVYKLDLTTMFPNLIQLFEPTEIIQWI